MAEGEVTTTTTPQVSEHWSSSLPADMQVPAVKEAADLTSFVKRSIDQQANNSRLVEQLKTAVKIPTSTSKPEDVKGFLDSLKTAGYYTRQGAPPPESADKYSLDFDAQIVPEPLRNPELIGKFRTIAYKHGLNQEAMNDLRDLYQETMKVTAPIIEIDRNEAEKEIQKRAAQDGIPYQDIARNAGVFMRDVLKIDEQQLGRLEVAGLANHPQLLYVMHQIGKHWRESGGHIGEGVPDLSAESEIKQIMGDYKGPYWDRKHPAHADTVAKVEALHKRAFPDPNGLVRGG
jgi:hypothetical protein